MGDSTDAMLERWEQFALRGGEFDLRAETSRLALDLVGRTLLGGSLRNEAETLAQATMVGVLKYPAPLASPENALSRRLAGGAS